ncbi:hypothetical protein CHARACLAT_001745 [Characodon lateralis]|uniref:Uncharacterized protein n=1 Tax=Characodon lateralis TaxID=208331 RepID=A0ABU7E0W0_9TELE|nr:hypothetical protein [Characodon lateralis]
MNILLLSTSHCRSTVVLTMTTAGSDIQYQHLVQKIQQIHKEHSKSDLVTASNRASVSIYLICSPGNWGQSVPCANDELKTCLQARTTNHQGVLHALSAALALKHLEV